MDVENVDMIGSGVLVIGASGSQKLFDILSERWRTPFSPPMRGVIETLLNVDEEERSWRAFC